MHIQTTPTPCISLQRVDLNGLCPTQANKTQWSHIICTVNDIALLLSKNKSDCLSDIKKVF